MVAIRPFVWQPRPQLATPARSIVSPDGSSSAMGPDPTLFGALGSVADDDAELMRMMHNLSLIHI